MKRFLVGLILVLASSASFGQELKIEGPTTVGVHRLARFKVVGDFDSAYFDIEPQELVDVQNGPEPNSISFVGPPGCYAVLAVGVKGSVVIKARLVVVIGGVEPSPSPQPIPPTPGPGPTPQPRTAPRVVFSYETSAPMTREHTNILTSPAIHSYLNSHCMKDSGGRPAWRRWDNDLDPIGESATWREAWSLIAKSNDESPKVIIWGGGAPVVLPLPETEAETLKLLKQFGGD